MTPISLQELADRLGGTFEPGSTLDPRPSTLEVSGFATDSRDVNPGDLFIAIRGAQVDGHAFVEAAFEKGAVAALVERPINGPHIKVMNVVGALARMARSFREEFEGPVIGITGSAGKSSCKEFLAAALAPLGRVLKTEGNRNTEYTAPLLWPGTRHSGETPMPRVVVVEMGMRGPRQIAHLASFSKPTIAVITNIGVSHFSELGSREAIARAKGELLQALPEDGVALLWAEDEYRFLLVELLHPTPQPPPHRASLRQGGGAGVLTFGFSESADARIVSYRATGWESAEIEISFGGSEYSARLPVVGRHQALNAAAAFLGAVAAGVPPALAAKGLDSAQLPPMRMAIRERGDITFVLDMYNASPPSVLAALETVRDVIESSLTPRPPLPEGEGEFGVTPPPSPLPATRAIRGEGGAEFVAVLGEMRELGEYTERGHREVGEALVRFGVDRVILLAPDAGANQPAATIWVGDAALDAGMPASNIRVVSSHEEVKSLLSELDGPAVVLVKGSRGVELERALPEGLL